MSDKYFWPRIPFPAFLIFEFGVVSSPTALFFIEPQSTQAKSFFDIDHPRGADVNDAWGGGKGSVGD